MATHPKHPRTARQPAGIRLPDLILRVTVAVMMFVCGTWWALGRIVAEKLATSLAMPAAVLWILLLIAVLAARRAGRTDLLIAAALPWTLLTLLGNGIVAGALARSLEQPFYDIRPLQSEPFDAVILLGGGTSTGGNHRIQANTAGDRVLLAAQMFHAGLAPRLLCSGRRIQELSPGGTDPAQEAQHLLTSLDVPVGAIQLLQGRNTSEEMQSLRALETASGQRIGVITSAWHLPRALSLARRNGLQLQPLPADFISYPDTHMTTGALILSCVPQDGALWTVAKVAKEYLGMLVGR